MRDRGYGWDLLRPMMNADQNAGNRGYDWDTNRN
jgi:hypothetical protein